jgi:hypothetical protein
LAVPALRSLFITSVYSTSALFWVLKIAELAQLKMKLDKKSATVLGGMRALLGLEDNSTHFEVLKAVAEAIGCKVEDDGTTVPEVWKTCILRRVKGGIVFQISLEIVITKKNVFFAGC